MFPATPGMVDLVNDSKARGYAVFFLTGRGDSQHAATIANLVNDTAAGFANIDSVTYSGFTVPEIDAGYVTPTPLDTGHGGFADGLFTKPPVGSYPAYLNTPRVLRRRDRRAGGVPDRPIQVRHPRLHRIAGLRHRRQLRRPVQRPQGRIRGQDIQDAQPELLPSLTTSQRRLKQRGATGSVTTTAPRHRPPVGAVV